MLGPQGDGLQRSSGTTGCSIITLRVHCVKGSPTKPLTQVHIGMWFSTLHSALNPQEPGQGSLHLSAIQAKFEAQSVLTTHSGLQFGGTPTKFGKHEHEG